MHRIISPYEFKEEFLDEVKSSQQKILDCWHNSKKYSDLFLRHEPETEGGLLQKVAKTLDLKYFKEYWSIDAIFYKEADEDKLAYGTYAKNLSAAIEHENTWNRSYEEINKLSIINAPLKVLITYPKNLSNKTEMLNQFAKMLKAADTFNDFKDKRIHLVISGIRTEDTVNWHFDMFDGSEFQEI